MLRRFHIASRFRAAALASACALALGPSHAGIAPRQAAAARAGNDERHADATGVVSAFMKARRWIDEFDTPGLDEPDANVPIERASAVCAILRLNGRIVGEGVDASGDDRMLRRAVGRALSQLTGHAALVGLPEDLRPMAGRRVTLELEVAGPMSPLVGRTFDEAAARVRPGLEGVAMRVGGRAVVVFPAQLLARNQADSLAFYLPSLLSDLQVRAEALDALRQNAGLTIHRFATTHLVQHETDGAPIATYRGAEIVPLSAATAARAASLACDLAEAIGRWELRMSEERATTLDPTAAREPVGMRGGYQIARDAHVPPFAPPVEQSLAAFALHHFARAPGMDVAAQGRAAACATRLLAALADRVPHLEPDPLSDLGSGAMIVLAGLESAAPPADRRVQTLLTDASVRVWESFDAAAGAFNPFGRADGSAAVPSSTEQAISAAAMARLSLLAPGRYPKEVARAAANAAWAAVDEEHHVGLLPWIGWAERDLREAGAADAEAERRLAAAMAFIRASQVSVAADPAAEPDLLGGIALAGRGGLTPTAQGLRPGAWWASVAADPQVTDSAELAEQDHAMRAFLRFLIQLSVSSEVAWAYESGERFRGCLRQSLWDYDLAVPAQSLGLFAAVDAFSAMSRLDAAGQNEDTGGR
jgi:hypothetical protein